MSASTTMPPQPAPSPCYESFTMTIGSYSEAKKLANGSYITSNPIDVGGHSWRIAFYPNGKLAGTTASTSLFLMLDDAEGRAAGAGAGGDEDVHANFRFLLREAGEGTMTFRSCEVDAAFSRRRNAHGFERFVSREDFEKLFKRDRFVIRCDLIVFPAGTPVEASRSGQPVPAGVKAPPPAAPPKPSVPRAALSSSPRTSPPPPPPPANPSVGMSAQPSASPPPSVGKAQPPSAASPAPSVGRSTAPPPPETPVVRARAPLSGLPADLGRLLATKEGADVELEVCGKVVAAHKSVLAARSSVFKEEFFGPAKEKNTSYVLIQDMHHPEAFEALLHYMYTDSLPEMTMNSLKEGAVLAEDLLIAADRYNLKDLKSLTENKLCSHVGVSTVLLLLAIAEQYQCCKLKKMCLGFIGSSANARAIMASNDVENLARSSPSVVKDVIAEILETREARGRRLINVCLYAFCFILPFLVAILNKQ